jgi:hypothetical protein
LPPDLVQVLVHAIVFVTFGTVLGMRDTNQFTGLASKVCSALSKKRLGNRVLEYLTWIVEKSKTQESSHRAAGGPMSYRALETYRSDLRAMIKYKLAPPFTKVIFEQFGQAVLIHAPYMIMWMKSEGLNKVRSIDHDEQEISYMIWAHEYEHGGTCKKASLWSDKTINATPRVS